MGLILCFCCGKQKEVKPIPKGAKYRCSNCGAKRVRVIRSKAHANYISWADKEGVNAESARHETYAGLKKYAERRGYKQGWISHKFKEIFGRWPNGEGVESAAPASHGLLQWIGKQNAAYAKELRLAGMGDRVPMRSGIGLDNNETLMNDDDWGVKL